MMPGRFQHLKTCLAVCTFLTASITLTGQAVTISETAQLSGIDKVKMDFMYGDVTIERHQGSTLEITGTVLINRGENNDAYDLDISKAGSELIVTADVDDMDQLPRLIIGVKGDEKYYLGTTKSNNWGGWSRHISKKDIEREEGLEPIAEDAYDYVNVGPEMDIALTIKVPTNMEVDIKTTYGNVELKKVNSNLHVKATYGSITGTVDRLQDDVSLMSVYDFVDISVPPSASLNLDLETSYGEIYSDLDLDIEIPGSYTKAFENHIEAKFNNGGPTMKLRATYGKIFVRLQKS